MPLVIQHRDNRSRPLIYCDHCNQQIVDAKDGNYEFPFNWDDPEKVFPIFFTHKKCARAFQVNNKEKLGWAPLSDLFVYLKNNLNVDVQKREKHITERSW